MKLQACLLQLIVVELRLKQKQRQRTFLPLKVHGGGPITQKEITPKIEGAIVIAEGARKY